MLYYQEMKKILFIGYYYHKKTKSCDFILSELKKEFILEVVFFNTDKDPYENLEYLNKQEEFLNRYLFN